MAPQSYCCSVSVRWALRSAGLLVGVHLTTSIPNGPGCGYPTYLIWFLAGMSLTVLQKMGVRC